jgi:hypothetical protein
VSSTCKDRGAAGEGGGVYLRMLLVWDAAGGTLLCQYWHLSMCVAHSASASALGCMPAVAAMLLSCKSCQDGCLRIILGSRCASQHRTHTTTAP